MRLRINLLIFQDLQSSKFLIEILIDKFIRQADQFRD